MSRNTIALKIPLALDDLSWSGQVRERLPAGVHRNDLAAAYVIALETPSVGGRLHLVSPEGRGRRPGA